VNNAGAVFFPLDRQLELWDKHWSAGLVKEAVWLSGVMGSFEQAEEAFARIGHVTMSDNTIWQRAKKWGERFQELEKQQQAAANQLVRLGEVGPTKSKSAVPMGVGIDGASLYIRQEG
jgi:hypothetical protein